MKTLKIKTNKESMQELTQMNEFHILAQTTLEYGRVSYEAHKKNIKTTAGLQTQLWFSLNRIKRRRNLEACFYIEVLSLQYI